MNQSVINKEKGGAQYVESSLACRPATCTMCLSVKLLLVFFIFLLPLYIYQFWYWNVATTTVCTSDDDIEGKQSDTFFIFVQMNPHAVCKLRRSSHNNLTSTNTSALPGCKSVVENIPQDWTIDHFFPWHGKYGLSLTTIRPSGPLIPCPFFCDGRCTKQFNAGTYEEELSKYWLDPIYSKQKERWLSEWLGVQPCFQLAQGIVMPNDLNPSVQYSSEILNLYINHNITASLAHHGITPSDTIPYSLKEIESAFSRKVILGCRLNFPDCVLTRIGFCFNYSKSFEPTLIDCPDLYPHQKERPLPWILLDYSFKYYTEDGFVCSSNTTFCANVKYYGHGHD